MRRWASGVALVTMGDENHAHGMTVKSFISLSLDPALILVPMERTTRSHRMALEFGRFAVSILRADQQELSEIFAGRTSEDDKRFKGVKTQMAPSCIPVSEGALAILDCQINQTIEAGTHTLFIALVEHSHVSDITPPLLYFNRAYRKLS